MMHFINYKYEKLSFKLFSPYCKTITDRSCTIIYTIDMFLFILVESSFGVRGVSERRSFKELLN